jgi:hypothetical protein
MPTAYVFMNCNTGAEKRVVNELADLDEVLEEEEFMVSMIFMLK